MKSLLSFFVSLSLFISTQAQEGQFSAPLKGKINSTNTTVIEKDSKAFYAAERLDKSQSIQLSKFNLGNMKLEWSKTISYSAISADSRYEEIVSLGNQFFLFTSTFVKESELLQVYCTIINKEGIVQGEPALVHYALSEGRDYAPNFGLVVSPDLQKFLIYFDPPFERRTTEAIAMRCYSSIDLDMLWEKEIILPYRTDVIQVHQFLLDNNVNVYMMSGRAYNDNFSRLNKVESGSYIMYYYNAKDNKLKEYDVTLKEKQISSVGFRFDNELNIIVAGYYSLSYKLNASGTFFYNFGAKGGGVIAASFMPLKDEVTYKYVTDKERDIIPDLHLKEINVLSNGNVLLIGEQQYTTESVQQDLITNSSRVETRYHYADLLVSKLEPSGKHISNTILAKHQYCLEKNDDCSFAFFTDGSSALFFYNDAADKAADEPWLCGSKSVTAKAIISENGNIIRDTAFDNKEKSYQLRPAMTSRFITIPYLLGYCNADGYSFCISK